MKLPDPLRLSAALAFAFAYCLCALVVLNAPDRQDYSLTDHLIKAVSIGFITSMFAFSAFWARKDQQP